MVVVVWKKSERAKTHQMTVFTRLQTPDPINTTRARNPVIPNESPFIELGVGESFIEDWKTKYKIKKVQWWPKEDAPETK